MANQTLGDLWKEFTEQARKTGLQAQVGDVIYAAFWTGSDSFYDGEGDTYLPPYASLARIEGGKAVEILNTFDAPGEQSQIALFIAPRDRWAPLLESTYDLLADFDISVDA